MRTLLLLLLLLPALRGEASVIDRVVVVVDDQLVMASEVRLEEELARLDSSPLPYWAPSHGTALERLIDAAVVRRFAADVALYEADSDAVAARIEGIRTAVGSRAAWVAFLGEHGMDEGLLAGVVKRRMLVERYLARNLQQDPAEPEAWLRASDALMDQLRSRTRVREIAPRGGP